MGSVCADKNSSIELDDRSSSEWLDDSSAMEPVLTLWQASDEERVVGPSVGTPKRILFVVNADWFFLSHRTALAEAAANHGYEVIVATPNTGQAHAIIDRGYGYYEIPDNVKGLSPNPIAELKTLFALYRLIKEVQPDIVHLSTPKVVTYGSIAARMLKNTPVISLVSGLGYLFSKGRKARLLNPLVKVLYRLALRHPRSCTVFQNPQDRAVFVRNGFVDQDCTSLIRGSGVDCCLFVPCDEPPCSRIVLLPSRLLWDKGVGEFVQAARELRDTYPDVRFVLAGQPDNGNPTSIPEKQLTEWANEGVIEWWGHRTDMPNVMAAASIVVLPSYHEGLPKALLEAAAAGRPIVATDIAGCREAVREGVNGCLVPVGDSKALAKAIDKLLSSSLLRHTYGMAGRQICIREFDEHVVQAQFMAVCQDLLGEESDDGITYREAAIRTGTNG